MIRIKSSDVTCKGNVSANFISVPDDIFNYIELGLITGNDLTVFIKLLDLYNLDYGYAYPTIDQLEVMTKLSRSTLTESLKKLEYVGLIKKAKGRKGNNVYGVYKPLKKDELYEQVPDLLLKLEKKRRRKN
ncbi:hypothetical protein FIU87_05460 [Bacillus sp. THAF10]|uniref:transcriptional regulator n=1 Tax=Bacillus sp. THAF10 TaxID=2587848 RepID=UPI0012688AA0|nr:transcriptional regulator [Bacillus sp. THAF10]QFT88079.1 hypothetical protein FIU87_05460 [Bacillus sp. THAF10]